MECGWQSSFTAFFTEKHICPPQWSINKLISFFVFFKFFVLLMGLSSANYSP